MFKLYFTQISGLLNFVEILNKTIRYICNHNKVTVDFLVCSAFFKDNCETIILRNLLFDGKTNQEFLT